MVETDQALETQQEPDFRMFQRYQFMLSPEKNRSTDRLDSEKGLNQLFYRKKRMPQH